MIIQSPHVRYSKQQSMSPHFFFGLAAAADARMVCRMSFLMLASNFRVGTRFSSFFRPSSIGGSL